MLLLWISHIKRYTTRIITCFNSGYLLFKDKTYNNAICFQSLRWIAILRFWACYAGFLPFEIKPSTIYFEIFYLSKEIYWSLILTTWGCWSLKTRRMQMNMKTVLSPRMLCAEETILQRRNFFRWSGRGAYLRIVLIFTASAPLDVSWWKLIVNIVI